MASPDTLTRERAKFEATKRNQATMGQVETLLLRESASVLNVGRDMSRMELGGFLRTAVPGLIDRWGNVNAAAAAKYYDEQRLAWAKANPTAFVSSSAGRKNQKNSQTQKAQRFAAARLKSQVYLAQIPKFDAPKLADPIVGYGMARFTEEGFDVMRDQVSSAMTRAVASYNRDTILYNASIDDAVVGVQRVAEPDSCAFCAMVAFGSGIMYGRESRVSSYAIDFHNNCRCSIETLYVGDNPIRPDYYDQFEQEYADSYSGGGTKARLQDWREKTGRR